MRAKADRGSQELDEPEVAARFQAEEAWEIASAGFLDEQFMKLDESLPDGGAPGASLRLFRS